MAGKVLMLFQSIQEVFIEKIENKIDYESFLEMGDVTIELKSGSILVGKIYDYVHEDESVLGEEEIGVFISKVIKYVEKSDLLIGGHAYIEDSLIKAIK